MKENTISSMFLIMVKLRISVSGVPPPPGGFYPKTHVSKTKMFVAFHLFVLASLDTKNGHTHNQGLIHSQHQQSV